MDEERFTDLIRRYQAGTATTEEGSLIERWLNTRGADNKFSRLSFDEIRNIQEAIYGNLLGELNDAPGERPVRFLRWGNGLFLRAAAVIAILILSYVAWRTAFTSRTDQVIVQGQLAGEINKVILPDSSIVWLKDCSTLEYPQQFARDERRVLLTGEALFEVTKNPAYPFVVQCGALTARVLGTSFNIKSGSEAVEVMVLTGKVALSSDKSKKPVIVLSNEKGRYQAGSDKIEKLVPAVAEDRALTAGTEYSMFFENTRLLEVIQRIQDKFNVHIELENTGLYSCTINADFTDQSLQGTLSVITQMLKAEYESTANGIVLKGGECR